MVVLVSDHNC